MLNFEDEDESRFRKCSAVNRRRLLSPAVMPYCSADRPVFGERRMSDSNFLESCAGNVAVSVNPAASEISFGRVKAVCISHEMGGSAVRCPSFDNAGFMSKGMDGNRIFPDEASRVIGARGEDGSGTRAAYPYRT